MSASIFFAIENRNPRTGGFMALLTAADRADLWRAIMDDLSAERDPLGTIAKAELRAAVDAADAWVDTNSASYNAALPQPARGVLTAAQKARILVAVIRQRWIRGV